MVAVADDGSIKSPSNHRQRMQHPSPRVRAAGRRSSSPAHKKCWWKCGSFFRNVMTVSLDDICGLIDSLLLLDALMLSALIALLTQASVSKDDLIAGDAFRFDVIMVKNGLDETHIPINSHYILLFGQIALGCHYVSIACALSTYLNLNLSRAREDDEIRASFAKHFMPLILAAYGLFIAGLFFFFLCLQSIVAVVFPAYCHDGLNMDWDEAHPDKVYPVFRNGSMHTITPDEYEECIEKSLLLTYFHLVPRVVMAAFPSILVAGFVLNAWVDCTHELVENEGEEGKAGGEGSEEDVGELLLSLDPRYSKYLLRFNAADIHPGQLPHLEKRDLLHIGVTLGDAIRMLGQFRDLGDAMLAAHPPANVAYADQDVQEQDP